MLGRHEVRYYRKTRYLTSLFGRNHLLHERFEARIAVQRIEQWIYFDPADVGAVAFLVTLFEPAQRFIFIVQAEIKQSAQVADYLTVLTYLIELAQHSPRGILVTRVSFSRSAKRRNKRVLAWLLCLFVFGNRAREIALRLQRDAEIIARVEVGRIDPEC